MLVALSRSGEVKKKSTLANIWSALTEFASSNMTFTSQFPVFQLYVYSQVRMWSVKIPCHHETVTVGIKKKVDITVTDPARSKATLAGGVQYPKCVF